MPERKLGFFVKIKPPAGRTYAPEGKTKILTTGIVVVFRGLKFESEADIGGKDSFRSGTTYVRRSEHEMKRNAEIALFTKPSFAKILRKINKGKLWRKPSSRKDHAYTLK